MIPGESAERSPLQAFLDYLVSASKVTRYEADVLHAALQTGRGEDAWDDAACRRISGEVWSWSPRQAMENRVYVLGQLEAVTVPGWLARPLASFVADLLSDAETSGATRSDERLEYLKAVFCACLMLRNPPRPSVAASHATIARPDFPQAPAPVSTPRR